MEDKEEGREVTEEEEEEENEERKGRLSIALTNCGDVLERQLFDARSCAAIGQQLLPGAIH